MPSYSIVDEDEETLAPMHPSFGLRDSRDTEIEMLGDDTASTASVPTSNNNLGGRNEGDARAPFPTTVPASSSSSRKTTSSWRYHVGVLLFFLAIGYGGGFTSAWYALRRKKGSNDSGTTRSTRIEHVVVLYFENRAYDTMLGWYSWNRTRGDGLEPGVYSNEVVTTQEVAEAAEGAPLVAPFDPNHGMWSQTYKLFGVFDKSAKQMADAYAQDHGEGDDVCVMHPEWCVRGESVDELTGDATMEGFFGYEAGRTDLVNVSEDYAFVMHGFAPEQVPVLTQLADEFVVFDKWFSSVPGPSWPNHMFSYSATSRGNTETGHLYQGRDTWTYPQRTIFQSLLDAGLEWQMIYDDSVDEMYVSYFRTEEAMARTHPMAKFYDDAKTGTLPALTWITPRRGVVNESSRWGGPNSDHPHCCDVALGELLRKQVYEALRASPAWEKTLLLITYDDAGGFYDHVPPPSDGVPPPGGWEDSQPDPDFGFDRLGPRVPTIAVSPWLPRGRVVSDPGFAKGCQDGNKIGRNTGCGKPTQTSQYDGSSLCATVKEIFDLPDFLTQRDAWAGSFAPYLERELDAPRLDTPETLVDAPDPSPRPEWLSEHHDDEFSLFDEFAPPPGATRRSLRARRLLSEDGDDPRYDADDGLVCDMPTRNQRRSLQLWDKAGADVPQRLLDCANRVPHWRFDCPDVHIAEASAFLANATHRWLVTKDLVLRR